MLSLIDEVTETRGRGNKECIGQGVANSVTGFFGGMGGCAMIGQSMINVNSGGRGRLRHLSRHIPVDAHPGDLVEVNIIEDPCYRVAVAS